MMSKDIKIFKILIVLNTIASLIITYQIILYNIEKIDFKVYFISFYALIWFFSLYKLYNFSKIGLKLYLLLVIFGFILNALSDYKVFGALYYFMSLFEHLIIGGILAFSFFSNIKLRFK